MSVSAGTKINQLLANTSPSGLMFSEWMKRKGYSSQLQKRYRDTGWLTTLCKGVMFRSGNRLNAFDALASYNLQMGRQLRIEPSQPWNIPALTIMFPWASLC